ncbi:membrane protein insertion efficiency factor YidD [Candidatus Methylacidithermus pantelleriae]|uniref:Putative membrane protein insertion efficiency factor n=1 Tax=Candidatus Methylacidithermus pantelleriae TaxID=2744239 RepID=A0A8J2BV26_9BACT|nr:membrane protein insertion efficiency factor YidD [Candidatus Methylacidithermus pantelleriae]CAF0701077.1 membrane protein insertion efficiency factor [Candidatus Methylacidithermus pantelleriae]
MSPARKLLWLYRVLGTPLRVFWLGGLGHCRYFPTCSVYFVEAVERHGWGVGVYLAMRRLLRCHPWGGYGYDPVPPRLPGPRKRNGRS